MLLEITRICAHSKSNTQMIIHFNIELELKFASYYGMIQ